LNTSAPKGKNRFAERGIFPARDKRSSGAKNVFSYIEIFISVPRNFPDRLSFFLCFGAFYRRFLPENQAR
jgi:hypothetical protein